MDNRPIPSSRALIEIYPEANLGDDLFLRTVLTRYPDVLFRIVADSNAHVGHLDYSNLEVVHVRCGSRLPPCKGTNFIKSRMRQRLLLHELQHEDCLVVVGGSLFIQSFPSGAVSKIMNSIMVRDRHGVYKACSDTFVLGANFGPYYTSSFLEGFREIFSADCADVCFRDRYSFELFSDLGNVRIAPDILFSTTFPGVDKQRHVFMSVINLRSRQRSASLAAHAAAYESWMARAARWFAEEGYAVTVCSFCKAEGDEEAVERVADAADGTGVCVSRLFYRGDVDEVLREIAASEVVVATRFHAMVLGLAAGAKVLSIPYSGKMTNVLCDLGLSGHNVLEIPDIDPEDMGPCEEVVASEPFDASRVAREAEGHFEALDAYFGRKSPSKGGAVE